MIGGVVVTRLDMLSRRTLQGSSDHRKSAQLLNATAIDQQFYFNLGRLGHAHPNLSWRCVHAGNELGGKSFELWPPAVIPARPRRISIAFRWSTRLYFLALATDYDGTIAEDGIVDAVTLAALDSFKKTGRRLILVTGRELPDLKSGFSVLELFALVV